MSPKFEVIRQPSILLAIDNEILEGRGVLLDGVSQVGIGKSTF